MENPGGGAGPAQPPFGGGAMAPAKKKSKPGFRSGRKTLLSRKPETHLLGSGDSSRAARRARELRQQPGTDMMDLNNADSLSGGGSSRMSRFGGAANFFGSSVPGAAIDSSSFKKSATNEFESTSYDLIFQQSKAGVKTNVMQMRAGTEVNLAKLKGPVTMEYEEGEIDERLEDVKAMAGNDAVFGQQEKDRRNTIKYTKKHIREADQKYHLKDYRCAESRQNGDCVKDKFKRCQANPPCGRVHLVGQKKPKHSQASKYYMLQKQVNPATGEKIFTMSPVDDWYEFQKKRNIKSRMTSEQYDNRSLKMGGKLAKFETHLSNHKKGFESAASRTGAWSDKMEQRQGAENADARTDQMQSELKITAKLTTDEKEKAEIQKMQNTMGDMGGFTVKKEVKLRASMKLAADENPDLEEFENETTDFFAADSDDELAGQGPAKDGVVKHTTERGDDLAGDDSEEDEDEGAKEGRLRKAWQQADIMKDTDDEDDDDDDDEDEDKNKEKKPDAKSPLPGAKDEVGATPVPKRQRDEDVSAPPAKKSKPSAPKRSKEYSKQEWTLLEETVRKYLGRKPMTMQALGKKLRKALCKKEEDVERMSKMLLSMLLQLADQEKRVNDKGVKVMMLKLKTP